MAAAAEAGKINSREELIAALKTASEIEQLLCCEYLYAGWSVRRTPEDFPAGSDEAAVRVALDRSTPWLAQINLVARQEMEHLGLVQNLLTAVGEEPYLERREFPQPPSATVMGIPFCLDRFGVTSLQRFIWGERPSYLTPRFPATCTGLEEWDPASEGSAAHDLGILSITDLYQEIADAFAALPAREVFVGDPDRQLGDVFSFRVKMRAVTNREDAAAAIQQILEEGEGIGDSPLTSTAHFERFSGILTEMEELRDSDPGFEAALPSITNPLVNEHPQDYPSNVIRRRETVAVMELFNSSYHTMLVMLKTFFATYDPTFMAKDHRAPALFYGAFFPLMTMVLRPLGEILARMPAGDEYPGLTAGASFELHQPVPSEPDVEWYRQRLTRAAHQAKELHDAVPDRLRPNMTGVYQSLVSTRLHLEHIWRKGE